MWMSSRIALPSPICQRRVNDSTRSDVPMYGSGIGGDVPRGYEVSNAPETPRRPPPRSPPETRRATDGGRREISKDLFPGAHRSARGDNAGGARARKFAVNAQGQGCGLRWGDADARTRPSAQTRRPIAPRRRRPALLSARSHDRERAPLRGAEGAACDLSRRRQGLHHSC